MQPALCRLLGNLGEETFVRDFYGRRVHLVRATSSIADETLGTWAVAIDWLELWSVLASGRVPRSMVKTQ